MKNGNRSEKALREEISSLQEKLLNLTSRLQLLEGRDGDGNAVVQVNSRRDLLKLAGALAAGAAGAVVLRPLPAGAAVPGNVQLGQTSPPNDSNATTHLGPTAASTPSPLVQIEGQGLPTGTLFPANPNAHSHQGGTPGTDQPISLPLLLVVGPYGVFPTSGTPAVTVYPGLAPLQVVAGPVNDPVSTLHVAEGISAFARVDLTDVKARGAGIVGQSDNDIGVVGSGSTDLAAFGAGYIAQASITDNANPPNAIAGPPPPPVYNFEQARDKNGVLWLSNPDGSWRRMNSVIPITPVRVIETRSNVPGGVVGGVAGPLAPNSTHTWTIAGSNGIPANAVGIMGNLTAVGPSADGFMTIFPGPPTTVPQATSIDYTKGISALANQVIVGFNASGQIQIYVSGNGSTQAVLDVTAIVV